MELQEFKKQIENKTIDDSSYIFWTLPTKKNNSPGFESNDKDQRKGESFCCFQYIEEISKIKNKSIVFLDNLSCFESINPFIAYPDIYVYETKKLDNLKIDLKKIKNLFIICEDIAIPIDSNLIISFNKLENWQIKDFVKANLKVSDKVVEWLCNNCQYNIYRLANEIDRLKIFDNQEVVFKNFFMDNIYEDISDKTILSFSNAIQNKDYQSLSCLYSSLHYWNIEPLVLISILYKTFNKLLLFMSDTTGNLDSLDIKSSQVGIYRKLAGLYSPLQVMNVFTFLGSLQENLVKGILPQEYLFDYTVLNVLQIGRN